MILLDVIKKVMLKNKCCMAAILLFSILIAFLPLLQASILERLVGKISEQASVQTVTILIVCFLIISLVLPKILDSIQYLMNKYLSHLIDCETIKIVYDKVKKIQMPILETGEKINLIHRAMSVNTGGLQSIAVTILSFVIQLVSMILLIAKFGILGILLALISFIIILPYVKASAKITDKTFQIERAMEEENRMIHYFRTMLTDKMAAAELFAYQTRDLYNTELLEKQEKVNTKKMKFDFQVMIKQIFHLTYRDTNVLLPFILIFIYLINNWIEVPTAISASYAVFTIAFTLEQMVGIYNLILYQKRILDEFEETMNLEEEMEEGDCSQKEEGINIQFDHVDYIYPGTDEPVIQDVSFTIKDKEKIAVVGYNGAGKSTLIRLLMGYDDPGKGEIKLNDSDYNFHKIRSATSIMLQNFCKYQLSLKENITISNLSEMNHAEKLQSVVEWTKLDSFINNLPENYETEIKSDGIFSGGEWQKIALARAKFRDSEIYILDEPNAAVDALYELQMYQNFLSLSKDKIMIVVSHRLPICQLCDRIIVLDKGAIVEMGSHSELIQKENGYYSEMFMAQANLYK